MVSIRSASTTLLTLAAVLFAVPSPAVVIPVAATTLSGIVRDDGGRLLEGAEIIVLAQRSPKDGAALRAITDAGGRFVVGSIAPGVYRVAAIKTGYIVATGSVNTMLRASIDLVLRPMPQPGQPGSETVLPDMSWALRVPKRSIMRDIDSSDLLASRATGGVRAFAAKVEDALRGEVDHMVAVGRWRPAATGPSSSLEGNETRMRVAGALGERGAIQLQGRRGSLDSAASGSPAAVSRGASDVGLNLSYDTNVDETLAVRAFYSAGDLSVGHRQSQRSWGYDAKWRKQMDASSQVAVQVGYHDASIELGAEAPVDWDATQRDASNRGIGAAGSYETFVGDGHFLRLGVRAQLLSLAAPSARLGRPGGSFALDGSTGWSLLVDSEDQWALSGPFAVSYGLAARQDFDGAGTTTLTPRVGGSWAAGRLEARAGASYLAGGPAAADRRPLGYDVQVKARLDGGVSVRGTAGYLPSRASVYGEQDLGLGLGTLYVDDGFASDRFVALDVERAAAGATVSFRVARGRAEGALAPAFDDVPVVLLADRALNYDAARLGIRAPRAGSSVALEYRAIREHSFEADAGPDDAFRTVRLDFAQELVRFGGGRAACRFLMTARSAVGQGPSEFASDLAEARRFVAEHKRIGAGLSLAF